MQALVQVVADQLGAHVEVAGDGGGGNAVDAKTDHAVEGDAFFEQRLDGSDELGLEGRGRRGDGDRHAGIIAPGLGSSPRADPGVNVATIGPMKMLACGLLVWSLASAAVAAGDTQTVCNAEGTAQERDACAYRDFAAAVGALDRQYRSRLRSLRESDRKRLRAEQAAWLVQRDPRCREQLKHDEASPTGFAAFHACLTEATQARTRQLKTGLSKASR